jgi:signal transduction histidine kinase
MTAVFVVMVWHVHRRQLLLREVQRINLVERHRLERQQLFVRLASHELRTPITVARGYTELLRDAHPDPAAVEDAAVVLDELDKLGRITQRLVTLMQLDQPHPMRRFDMDAELVRTVRRWAPTADRQWTVESAIGDARANTERFEAALDCLVENAMKFTGPGDRIAVRGRRVREGWTVEVFDSGAGIAADDAHAALTGPPGRTTATGTGLGLAIVGAVAESLGGRLEIAPAPGGGTSARLCVPQPPLPAEPARLTGPDGDPSPAPRRVAPPMPSSA